MAYVTPHTWTSEQATVALMNEINNNLKALFPVGTYAYLLRAPTTVETFVESCWLEWNGVSVLRATYPDLNTLLSGLSYPFGTVDGTHMTLGDAAGRMLVSAASGGHAEVNALGDSDGLPKATRTPKHNSTVVGGSHTHNYDKPGVIGVTLGGTNINGGNFSTVATTSTDPGITVGPGGTRPDNTVPYLVGGTLFVKAVA